MSELGTSILRQQVVDLEQEVVMLRTRVAKLEATLTKYETQDREDRRQVMAILTAEAEKHGLGY